MLGDETVTIRPQRERDARPIREVHILAYGRENEAKVVLELAASPEMDPELALVAEVAHEVVGHLLLYPIRVLVPGRPLKALLMGPPAVRPDFQLQGIGTSLIREGLRRGRGKGYGFAVTVGPESFFGKFGFCLAGSLGLEPTVAVPPDLFLATELRAGALSGVQGRVELPEVLTLL
jgi:putative acetyltransferase